MATVWVRAQPANEELGAGKRGKEIRNTESGKQIKALACLLELSQYMYVVILEDNHDPSNSW